MAQKVQAETKGFKIEVAKLEEFDHSKEDKSPAHAQIVKQKPTKVEKDSKKKSEAELAIEALKAQMSALDSGNAVKPIDKKSADIKKKEEEANKVLMA